MVPGHFTVGTHALTSTPKSNTLAITQMGLHHIQLCAYIYIYVYIHIYTHINSFKIYKNLCACKHTHTHIYIYIYIYTHTHIYKKKDNSMGNYQGSFFI